MSRLSWLVGSVCSKVGCRIRACSPQAVCLAGLIVLALLVLPATALAACTDTWTGPAEGSWQTATDWSAAHVPTSSDVACIGTAATVKVTEGSNQAGVILDEGGLSVLGGTLEVSSTSEDSSVETLTVSVGTLTGAAEVLVTGFFSGGEFGHMTGTGKTVLELGSIGVVNSEDGSWLALEERTLENEGELNIGVTSGIVGSGGAKLLNRGTLIVNGEKPGSDHGLFGSAASLTNTGTIEKVEGAGLAAIGWSVDNEGAVSVTSGQLEFSGGGTSGVKKTGSWSASGKESEVVFGAGSFALGTTVSLSGAIDVTAATVTAGKVEGAEASLSITDVGNTSGVVEINGGSPSTIQNLTVSGVATELAGGRLVGSGEVDITGSLSAGHLGTLAGSGSTVIEPEAKGTILSVNEEWLTLRQRTLSIKGSLTIPAGAGIVGAEGGQIVNSGTLTVNGEKSGANHGLIAPSGEAGLTNTGTLQKTEGSGMTVDSFITNNEGSVKVASGQLEFRNGGVSGGKSPGSWSALGTGTEIIFGPGTFELGSTASLSGAFYVSEGTVIAGIVEGATASMTITKATNAVAEGIVEINGVTPSKLQDLTITGVSGELSGGGVLQGTGEVDVTGAFTGGTMEGWKGRAQR